MNTSYNDRFTNSVNKIQYLQYVGLLNYLAVNTRPDILFALSVLASPTEGDLKRVMHVFQYLENTKQFHLIFKRTDKLTLLCYADASHNQYPDGRGHYGYYITLGDSHGPISMKVCVRTFISEFYNY